MNKNITTKADFDQAVKQKHDTTTCVIAQTHIRTGISMPEHRGFGVVNYDLMTAKQRSIMRIFDNNFWRPGDENKPELQALRASLPD